MEMEENRLEKDKLMVAIEKLRHKRGHFEDKESKDALKDVADALQLELWGNLDRKKPNENPGRIPSQEDEIRERKIENLIQEYEKSHSDDIMGIIVLNALKSSGNMEEAISFYEAAIQEDRLYFRSSKEIKTLEGKYDNLGSVFLIFG